MLTIKTIRVGIIGYGKIGKIRKDECSKIYPSSEFRISDPYVPNVKYYTPEEVIEWADIIFICATNDVNSKYTCMALEADKHVFCEKPPAISYDDLLRVKDVYEKHSHLTLIYGFNHRQYDSIQKMKSIIDDPETGNVLWMRGRYGKAMGDPISSGWRSDPTRSGGGILLDQGIHMLDLMNYFGGKFDVVHSIITNNMWNIKGIEDNAFVNMYNSEKGIAASLHSTMIEWRHIFSLEVLLEHEYIALNGLKTPSGSYGKEVLTICSDKHKRDDVSQSIQIEFKNNKTWEKEVRNFLSSVELNESKTNLPDALEVMRIIKEAYNERH